MAEATDVLLRLDRVAITDPLDSTELVQSISFTLRRGAVLGIVGESGSGKTLTCRAALGILPDRLQVSAGSIEIFGADAATLTAKEWTALRGSRIGAVFQDPGSYLNPSIRVGPQVAEVLRVKAGLNRRQARRRAVELFGEVRLADPDFVYQQYPHELSGGMLQRVLIAAAIALEPEILIADEATTALDVTVQAEILDLLVELKERIGLALVVVAHDLTVVAQLCDEVLVMRDGEVVEHGSCDQVLRSPQHAYTRLLISEHHQYGLDRFRAGATPRTEVLDRV
ncbi:ABC transporter ATP-binding protein [uncultured Friedmanniella sp.]|uniref:ABC transporter ATP-binding protein n=1 Tax=uncultured Friedmanniella sp. TaxID=335381 RepID=UPI0035CA1155